MTETLPGVKGRVFAGSNTLPSPMCSVPEMMVMCSMPGCQCGMTLKLAGNLSRNMIGTGLSSGPSMTAIFTPGSDGKSFHTSSEGSSMMCPSLCCANACGPNNAHARTRLVAASFILRPPDRSSEKPAAGPAAGSLSEAVSAVSCHVNRLHDILHHMPSDLATHILSDTGREPIVETGIDAGHRHFVGIGPNVAPAVGGAGRRRARHRDFRNIRTCQHRFNHRCEGRAADAVGTGIFRVHRRVVDRLPGRVKLGRGIVVIVAIADRRDRPPKVVMILGIEHRDERIRDRRRSKSHEAGAVEDIHSLRGDELPSNGIVAHRPGDQPKLRILGLPRSPLAAGLATEALDLVVVACPFLTLQRNRRLRPELRRTLHREWFHIWPHG